MARCEMLRELMESRLRAAWGWAKRAGALKDSLTLQTEQCKIVQHTGFLTKCQSSAKHWTKEEALMALVAKRHALGHCSTTSVHVLLHPATLALGMVRRCLASPRLKLWESGESAKGNYSTNTQWKKRIFCCNAATCCDMP